MKSSFACLAVLVLVALGAAGCGGGNKQSATEKWADTVCTAIGSWRSQLTTLRTNITNDVKSGTLNENEIKSALDQAQSATTKLVNTLKSAGPPQTSDGQQAKQTLNSTLSTVSTQLSDAKSKAESAGSASAAVLAAAPDITQAADAISSGFQQISQLNPGGELQKAINNTKSCQDLKH